MEYYCIHHYNMVNNTSYTYNDVIIEFKYCELCELKTLCVVDFGHEYNQLVEKCKDDVQFVFEMAERQRNRYKRKLRYKKRNNPPKNM